MKETWTKAVLVNIGNYENVRVERGFEYEPNALFNHAHAVRAAEVELAKEILTLKPVPLRGEYASMDEIKERRRRGIAEVLGRYGLAHVAGEIE